MNEIEEECFYDHACMSIFLLRFCTDLGEVWIVFKHDNFSFKTYHD